MAEVFGTAPDGSSVQRVVIGQRGLTANLISYGAVLQDLRLADWGHPLVLGYPELGPYLENPNYLGAIVGRFANRLRDGAAMIAGRHVQMDRNTRHGHLLHGGRDGTATRNWQVVDATRTDVRFETQLSDGHMGFPGNLLVAATYRVLPGRILEVEISAQTDAATLCSFAPHSYFNLDGSATINAHHLGVAADLYLPTDHTGIPQGVTSDVSGTDFDFRNPKGRALDRDIDHNLCLSAQRQDLRDVAELTGVRGVSMTVATTEPGLQVYTGHGMTGAEFSPRAGVALEPQLWPDAPHHAGFPSAQLLPGEAYKSLSRFRFNPD